MCGHNEESLNVAFAFLLSMEKTDLSFESAGMILYKSLLYQIRAKNLTEINYKRRKFYLWAKVLASKSV